MKTHLLFWMLFALSLQPIQAQTVKPNASYQDVMSLPPDSQIVIRQRYAQLDRFARNMPEIHAVTIKQLAASLGAEARNEQEKARLIFSWLAHHISYDVRFVDTPRNTNCEPSAVLRSRLTVCQGYADLFTALATQMKLPAKTISGYGRGRSGPVKAIEKSNHAWNIYKANGAWHLADATWASGSLIGSRFKKSFRPLWFDTSPDTFVFSHFPEDTVHQMLVKAVSRKSFFNWPYIDPTMLEFGANVTTLHQIIAGSKTEKHALPKIYDPLYGVRLTKIPLYEVLPAQKPVDFIFAAPNDVELAVKADGKYTSLEHIAGFRRAKVVPKTGEVAILVWKVKRPEWRYHLLDYKVVTEPPKRVNNQAQAADSIIYVRP